MSPDNSTSPQCYILTSGECTFTTSSHSSGHPSGRKIWTYWSEASPGPQRQLRYRSIFVHGEVERAEAVQPEEKAQRILPTSTSNWGEGSADKEAQLCLVVQIDKRQWIYTKAHGIPSEHKNTLFNCEGDQTQEQVAQRCCGDIKNPVDMVLSNSCSYICLGREAGLGHLKTSLLT